MTHTQINRRTALAAVATVPAAAALSAPALAGVGEDAELLRLWEECNAQNLLCRDAYEAVQQIEGEVWKEAGPVWEFAKLDVTGRNSYRALFFSSWHSDDRIKAVPFKAKDYRLAQRRADEARVALVNEREDCNKAAKRRPGHAKAERAQRETDRCRAEIEDQIAEVPAQGLRGIAVKLALWKHYSDNTDEPGLAALDSAYETLVKLTGEDPAAQVERW